MESKFERHAKYIVLKFEDINSHLSTEQQASLGTIVSDILVGRLNAGKQDKSYVCIAEDWPMYEQVWGMLKSFAEATPSELDKLRQQLSAAQSDNDGLLMALERFVVDGANLEPQKRYLWQEGRAAIAAHKARQQGKEQP